MNDSQKAKLSRAEIAANRRLKSAEFVASAAAKFAHEAMSNNRKRRMAMLAVEMRFATEDGDPPWHPIDINWLVYKKAYRQELRRPAKADANE